MRAFSRPPFASRWTTSLLLGLLAACGGGGSGAELTSPGQTSDNPGTDLLVSVQVLEALSREAQDGEAPRHETPGTAPGITGPASGTGTTPGSTRPATGTGSAPDSSAPATGTGTAPDSSAPATGTASPTTSPTSPQPPASADSASTVTSTGNNPPAPAGNVPPPLRPLPVIPPDTGDNVGSTPTGTRLDNGTRCSLSYYGKTLRRVDAPDPHKHLQWYLKNTGTLRNAVAGADLNVLPVHEKLGLRGQGIRVAVVDDGVELTHDDLLANVLPGASYSYRWGNRTTAFPLPCQVTEDHGTAVAGIIAARDNNGVGISGVAPRTHLVGLNPLESDIASDLMDALTRDAAHNHIYNNSWGAPDNGHFHAPSPSDNSFRKTLGDTLKTGRQGLGPIYVFAAGNGGQETDYAVYDGTGSALGTLAICAHNAAGLRSSYSEPGPNLLVCAPSGDVDASTPRPGVTTTDLDSKFTNGFSGTSAAAPMASGVIALMLQANPELSWRDVRLVLARSARKLDPYHPGWRSFGGLNFNHEYGFGGVDAEAAVNLARRWKSVGGSASLKTCGPFAVTLQGTDRRIPDAHPLHDDEVKNIFRHINLAEPVQGGLESTVQIPVGACDIQHVEHVDVTLRTQPRHRDSGDGSGDLHITLTSPSGQTSTLSTPHLCFDDDDNEQDCSGLQNFRFGLSRHLDEPATTASNRSWTLRAADRRTNSKRTLLQGWNLTIYGR